MSGYVDYTSAEYPSQLKGLTDAPKRLYYKGVWDPGIFASCVGVVGSRRMTLYGGRVTFKFVQDLTCYSVTIVSGFMYGVDIAAHEACVHSHGRTIAILPYGIDVPCDSLTKELYDLILEEKGLIISEYEGYFKPKLWTFHKRNRIIAGLSVALLVVEAALDSGSLITANYALKYGRKVFAVPGSIFSEYSKGTLQLISNGASMATSSCDIANYLHLETNMDSFSIKDKVSDSIINIISDKNSLEYRMYSVLEKNTMTADDLAILMHESVSVVNSKVTLMLLSGLINESDNKYFV